METKPTEKPSAEFIARKLCINCGSNRLEELSCGYFGDEPLRNFIENDPWGESPLPYIENKEWQFVRCKDCSQMFHMHVLSPVWNEKRFSEWMTQEAMQAFTASTNTPALHFAKAQQYVSHILLIEKMTADLRNNKAVRILDFGCGWGEFLAMSERFGFIAYGIDRSSSRRQWAQHIHVFPDIEDLKASENVDEGFHAITLFEVLEHLDSPLSTLQSLSGLIVSGGILILETPDCTNITDIKTARDYRHIHPLDHINGFTPDTLRSIAERAGFRPVMPGTVHVTCDGKKIVKRVIKQLAGRMVQPTTQQYFYKV